MNWEVVKGIIKPGIIHEFYVNNHEKIRTIIKNVSESGGFTCASMNSPELNYTCFYYGDIDHRKLECVNFTNFEKKEYIIREHPETLIHPYTEN